MFPGSTSGLYCPGCQPGDFAQPHICGLSTVAAPTLRLWTGTDTTYPVISTPLETLTASACDHCWCLKQKAGWHDVPSLKLSYPGFPQNTERRHLKPHAVCCNCGQRRVKEIVGNG